MDFASLMKSQITNTKSASQKYVKRGDLEAQRQEAYAKEQEELETARLHRLEKKRKRDEDEASHKQMQKEKQARISEQSRQIREEELAAEETTRRKRLGLPEMLQPAEAAIENDIADDELREKLKELDEPRVVFGETHLHRLRRYQAILETQRKQNMSTGPVPTYLELVEEKDMRLSTAIPTDKEGRLYLRRQLASYFDMVLTEWDRALRGRDKEVKDSNTGKQAYSNYAAAVSNLTLLFRKLEADELPDDILKPVVEIVNLAQTKRYVDANNAYIKLSIGNTAWPIGVTMVGIHERSAREKLNEDGNAGHIMGDESMRKMIQGIKRSLTFAQTRWPPDELGQLMG